MTWLALGVLGAGLTGCDSTGPGNDSVPLSLSFAVQPDAGLAGVAAATMPTATHGAASLELTEAELTVEELVLERTDGDGDGDSDGDSEMDSDSENEANEKFEASGAVVQLPLVGGIITPFEEIIPEGLYEEVELDIASVRFVGTVDGESFDVTVPVDLELEMEFDPPLEVTGEEPFNITIDVDVLAWLENDDGSFIDPRDIAGDPTLLNTLRQRMAVTFNAFEDSDLDADEFDSDSDSDGDSG